MDPLKSLTHAFISGSSILLGQMAAWWIVVAQLRKHQEKQRHTRER